MRGGPIDKCSAGRTERARMPDSSARAFIVTTGERALDVVLVSRGHAEPNHIDKQILALLAYARRQLLRTLPGNRSGQLFGNRRIGQSSAHKSISVRRARSAGVHRRASDCWQAPRFRKSRSACCAARAAGSAWAKKRAFRQHGFRLRLAQRSPQSDVTSSSCRSRTGPADRPDDRARW